MLSSTAYMVNPSSFMHINYSSDNLYSLKKIPLLKDSPSSKPYLNITQRRWKRKPKRPFVKLESGGLIGLKHFEANL